MKVYEIFSNDEPTGYTMPAKWSQSYGKLNRKIEIHLSDDDKVEVEFSDWLYGTPLAGNIAVITFLRDGYALNNKGDALNVFNVVLAVCSKYLSEVRPKYLIMSSKMAEESRTKLYRTMIRRLSPKFGYKQIALADLPEDLRNEIGESKESHDFILMDTSAR